MAQGSVRLARLFVLLLAVSVPALPGVDSVARELLARPLSVLERGEAASFAVRDADRRMHGEYVPRMALCAPLLFAAAFALRTLARCAHRPRRATLQALRVRMND